MLGRHLAYALGGIGLLLLIVGVYASPILSQDYVSAAESRIAFARLAEIPLDRIELRLAVSIPVTISDTPQWTYIRRVWGPPDYTIAAVSRSKNIAYCFSDMGLAIDIQRQGEQIATAAGGLPYGYSFANCANRGPANVVAA